MAHGSAVSARGDDTHPDQELPVSHHLNAILYTTHAAGRPRSPYPFANSALIWVSIWAHALDAVPKPLKTSMRLLL